LLIIQEENLGLFPISSSVKTTPLPAIVQPTSLSSEPTATPTVYERFLGPTMFSELFPHIRPYLRRGDLSRLAQVGGVIGGQATIAMYQEKKLQVVCESVEQYRQLAKVVMYGIDNVPRGRISKKEAMAYIREVDLREPISTIASNLLKLQFPHLRKLIIRSSYLRGILFISHASKTIPGIPYTDFYNPDTPFDFAESRLISHLASYASTVEIFAPGTGYCDMFDDRHRGKYWSDMAKRLCASGCSNLDEMVYWCASSESNVSMFKPNPYTEAFRTVPDFGKKLFWNQIQPVDKLVLWVKSPSAILQRIPANNTVINLQEGALFEPYSSHNPEHIPDLAVVRSILETRAVTSASVVITILPPALSAIVHHIRAVHPAVKHFPPPRHPFSRDFSSPWSEYQAIAQLFAFRKADVEKLDLYRLTKARYLECIKASLHKHHAKTDVEKEDFEQIQFAYRPYEAEKSYQLM
jgi:hypothetical protein